MNAVNDAKQQKQRNNDIRCLTTTSSSTTTITTSTTATMKTIDEMAGTSSTPEIKNAFFVPFDCEAEIAQHRTNEVEIKIPQKKMMEGRFPASGFAPRTIEVVDGPGAMDFSMEDEEETDHPIEKFQRCVSFQWNKFHSVIWRLFMVALLLFYSVYFGFAIAYSVEMATTLIVLTSLGAAITVYGFIRDNFGEKIYKNCLHPIGVFLDKRWHIIQWILYPALLIGFVLYLCLDVVREVIQLQSLLGMIIMLLILYISSRHPGRIRWRPIVWGFCAQIVMAIVVLRWEYGYIAIKWLADVIQAFIEFGFAGEAVVFGDPFLILHPIAFMGLPLLLYLGAVMSILYYMGLTQLIACKIAWLMQITMGTTAIETLNSAANIFLDGMDTMLMLRHYLDKLTLSEFNCLLTGNHATVAGFVFALFVLFGAPPQHLLSASVMSAPATIAICKLNYPETQKSVTKEIEDVKLTKGDDVNVFEAAANGAAVAGKTVATVGGCYIAFLSILAFINATLSYIGARVGHPELSFELMCSYIMWPMAYIIGIEYNDCQEAAKLMGIKLFATEVLAYQELGKSQAAGLLSDRSVALVTYAMCGFSSISTLAIAVGVWYAICPQRVKLMVSMMGRVFVEANFACYMTASVAGVFYSEEIIQNFASTASSPTQNLITWVLGLIPGYKDLMALGS